MVNVIRREPYYNFKNLSSTSEAVFAGPLTVNLYESQNCRSCGCCATGYYKYIREPQDFECLKCGYKWSIAVKYGVNERMDELDQKLYELDGMISEIKRMLK